LVLVLIVGLAAVGVAIVVVYGRRGSRRAPLVTDQWSALTLMNELCPHGWQADITAYGGSAPLPDDAPDAGPPRVSVEWRLYEHGSERVVVERRVSSSTIVGALQKMVDDRRLDVELERIESSAASAADDR
jgi:hypothetical protein